MTEEGAAAADTGRIGRVLQDSSLYFLGNLAGRAVGFLAIPFYSRYLSPAQYGLIELIELSTQTVAIAFGLQTVGAVLSRLFYDQKTAAAEREVVSTSLIGAGVLSGVVALLAALAAGWLSEFVFHTGEWTRLLQAAFAGMFLGNMIEVVLVYERIRGNARFVLRYMLATLVATLSLNVVLIGVLGAGVWGFVISKLIVSVVTCVYLALRMRRDVGWGWRGQYVPEFLQFGAPLVVSSLSYFAIHFSDRFFLSRAVSLADLGRYALAYTFAMLISALVGDSFAKGWEVTLYRYVDSPGWQARFAQVAAYLTFILFTTGLGVALFSPEVMRLMVPADYLPPAGVLPILVCAYVVREVGDFFRTLLLINKRSGLVGRIGLGGAVLNVAANFVLIPVYGVHGAALATLITWSGYMVVCWAIAHAEHRLPVSPFAYVRITGVAMAVYALSLETRVPGVVVQVALDGAWMLVFCGAAFFLFFGAAERRGALGAASGVWARGASGWGGRA